MTVIVAPRRTSIMGKVPTIADLADGEMGVNLPDGKIYQRSGSFVFHVGSKEEGTVKSVGIAPPAGFIAAGGPVTSTGDVYFNWVHPPNTPDTFLRAEGPGLPPSWTTLRVSDIPDLPATRLTSGTVDKARLPFPEDYIVGFAIKTTPTTIIVSSGEAFITSLGYPLSHNGITITSGRTANTTYHLYLTGAGVIERSTVAPGTPYMRGARWRGTTESTRYLGTVFTDGSGNYLLQKTSLNSNSVFTQYLYNVKASGALLTNGTASAATDITLTGRVPVTATDVGVLAVHSGSSGFIRILNYDNTGFSVYSNVEVPGTQNNFLLSVDSTPKIQYNVTTGAAASIYLTGYQYLR